MFNRRRRLDNAAAMPMPLPRQQQPIQVTHQNTPNWVGIILAAFAVVVIGAIVLWQFAVYLADAAGSRAPERDVSIGVFWLFIIAAATGIIYFGFVALIAMIGDVARDITKTIVDGKVQSERARLLAAQTNAIGERALDADYAIARACLIVLNVAYDLKRPYGNGEARPWVRDNAWTEIQKVGGIKGFKWSDCSRIKRWLEDNKFIVNDQLNRGKYPNFEDARRQIDLIAAPPLVINPPSPDYQEMSIIKNAN